MKNILIVLTTIFLMLNLLSCKSESESSKNSNNNEQNEDNANINFKFFKNFTDYKLRKENTKKIIEDADTIAYLQSYDNYMFAGYNFEFLYYALVMANKHKYPKAFLDVYKLLNTDEDNTVVDENLQKMRLYYLLKSYQLGFKSSKYYIEEEFGEGYDSMKLMKKLEILEKDIVIMPE